MINKFVKAITFGHFGNSSRKKSAAKDDSDTSSYAVTGNGRAQAHLDRSMTLPLSRPSSAGTQIEGLDADTLKRSLGSGTGTKTSWSTPTHTLTTLSSVEDASLTRWLTSLSRGDGGNKPPNQLEVAALTSVFKFAGHAFKVLDESVNAETWCDHCLERINGNFFGRRCLRCNLTCHFHCCPAVQVTCEQYFQHNLPDTMKAILMQPAPEPLKLNADRQALTDRTATLTGTLTIQSYSSTLPSNALGAWAYHPLAASTSYSTVYSIGSNEATGRSLHLPLSPDNSKSASAVQLAAPSFVRLLPEMCQVHSQTMRSHRKDKAVGARTPAPSVVNLREASLAAVSTPYDLSSLDHATLQRYGITVRTLSQNSLASRGAQLTAVLPTGQEISDLGLLLGNEKGTKVRWNLAELQRRIAIFTANCHGLTIHLESKPTFSEGELRRYTCTGTIRVHISIIRTVRLAPAALSPTPLHSHTARQSSMFDLVANTETPQEKRESVGDTQPVWLPRGISKLLHIDLTMTTKEVIAALLMKFQIKDNPRKFALYEHTIQGEREVSVRKLTDAECPLLLLLVWASTTAEEFNSLLLVKRLVLQENDTNDIDWQAFSLPELNNFLAILNREEQEYKRQIQLKYHRLREEITTLKMQKLPSRGT